MSIPKEPRQLMINLMYLVLMALLALNVSAEVMNAFFALDDGNKASMGVINEQLDETEKGLEKLLNDESKKDFQPILPAVEEIRALSKEYSDYVNVLRSDLIDETGNQNGEEDDGDYIEDHGKMKPKGKKDTDGTTRLLLNEGKGDELKEKTLEIRQKMIDIYTALLNEYGEEPFGLKKEEIQQRIANVERNVTLHIDDEIWKDTDKTSWADYKFRKMPLAAVLPTLSAMQSDAKTTEATLVNEMAALSGGREVVFDEFFPVVNAKKAYVIAGEPFEAEISVGTYSSSLNPSDITLKVNGSSLPVGDNGKAVFRTNTSSTGKKSLKLEAIVRNPLTGKVTSGDATYEYEVGRRSVAVAADKMNVFYLGVENPISISAAGVSTNDLQVNCSGCKLSGRGTNRIVTVDRPGEATVTVSGGGLAPSPFQFRVKRIPDPRPSLNPNNIVDGGSIGNGAFKAYSGLFSVLENFDFEARCTIDGFNLVYQPKRQDPVVSVNRGARYTDQSRRLAQRAKPGDTYYFENIKARCPGDPAGRNIGSMVFQVK